MINKEFLRYLDLFGTKCTFYTEQRLKLYTPLGGILSIASVVTALFIFIYINISSFKREDPTIITSSTKEENHRIKFNEEKIWLPWKISNYNNDNPFNFSGILLPVIKYYYKENNSELKSKNLSYKSCNETSMINMPKNYLIDSSLNQLYCIDMDDLFMGGAFSSNSFYYIEFSLYICNNEIKTDNDNNTNCISYNFNQNFLQIVFYYPILEFQQIDFETPINIRYHKNCVLLVENISKNEQIFLQKIKLYDKLGLFDTTTKIYKYWVYSYFNKDLYFIKNKKSVSDYKIYSIEIFIESNNIYYYRSYKSIFLILAQSLPLITLVHNLLKLTAKVFKLSSINRKMTELLFENLTIKNNKYDNYIDELKSKKIVKNKISNNNVNKSTEDNTFINLTIKDNTNTKKLIKFRSNSLLKKKNNNALKNVSGSPVINNLSLYIPEKNYRLKNRVNSFSWNNLVAYKKDSLKHEEKPFPTKKRFVANKLFPFRYYFCVAFVKNIDITKHRFFMSRKFVKVYKFLCQLFDISTYCALQREFTIVKNSIFDEQKLKLIEQKYKINVNSQNFMRDMNDCLGKNNFNIIKNNMKRRKSVDSRISKMSKISNYEKRLKK